MTAPLSTFMMQLMDESVSRQGESLTVTNNFYHESTACSSESSVGAYSSSESTVTTITYSLADISTATSTTDHPATIPATSGAAVPNKMPLRQSRKNVKETSTNANLNSLQQCDLLQTSMATAGSSGGTTMEFSSSLTSFMCQLLNDTEIIDKLIQGHDQFTEGESISNKGGDSINTNNVNTKLSKVAANVLSRAVRTIQRASREQQQDASMESSDADADDECSRSKRSKRPTNSNPPNRPSKSDSSIEVAKECWESIAKIHSIKTIDPYSLVKTVATAGGNGDLAKMHLLKGKYARSNSDGSISLFSTNKGVMQGSSSQSFSISGLTQQLQRSASLGNLRLQMIRIQSRENIHASSTELDCDEEETEHEETRENPPPNSHDDFDESTREKSAPGLHVSGIRKESAASGDKKRRPRSSTPGNRSKKAVSTKRQSKSVTRTSSSVDPTRSPSPAGHKRGSTSDRRGRTPSARRTPSTSKRTPSSTKEKRVGSSRRSPSVNPKSRGHSQDKKSRGDSQDKKSRGDSQDKKSRGDSQDKKSRGDSQDKKSRGDSHDKSRGDSQDKKQRSQSQAKTPRKHRSSEMKDASMKDSSMKDASMKRDKSKTRRSTRKLMNESSKRDASTGRNMRASTKTGECPATSRVKSPSTRARRTTTTGECPPTPRVKSPSTACRRDSTTQDISRPKTPTGRTRRASTAAKNIRSSSVKAGQRDGSIEPTRTPRTPKTTRTPKTPTSSTKRISSKPKTASRCKSFNVGVETETEIAMKGPLRRAKTATADQLLVTAAPVMPLGRRRNSMTTRTDVMDVSKADGLSKSHTIGSTRRRSSMTPKDGESVAIEPLPKPAKAKLRRNHTISLESPPVMTPMTPSARRRSSLTPSGLPSSTPRRTPTKDGAAKDARAGRRGSVAASKPPRRQQSEPVPTIQKVALLAVEAAQAAKEMEQKRARSKSVGSKLIRKLSIAADSQQSSKPSLRRGTRQRSNQQAQHVLRQALVEEIKSKETVVVTVNPLAVAPEGVKEATWISRRKSRHLLSQQSQARLATGAGA